MAVCHDTFTSALATSKKAALYGVHVNTGQHTHFSKCHFQQRHYLALKSTTDEISSSCLTEWLWKLYFTMITQEFHDYFF